LLYTVSIVFAVERFARFVPERRGNEPRHPLAAVLARDELRRLRRECSPDLASEGDFTLSG
jgi:hypothetical protein